MPGILGLDVGGANLKAAAPTGETRSVPFALWRHPEKLPAVVAELVAAFDPAELAVTMTGELCDCFRTKRDGVNAILDAVAATGPPVRVWGTRGEFIPVEASRRETLTVAAANWHATATYAGRFCPTGHGLLLDTGSTTTDVIRLEHGLPANSGSTDVDRLRTGELVYVGARRTPLMALLPKTCAELFATTLDVGLILGLIPEDESDCDTADGRPATVTAAFDRIARVIGGDSETVPEETLIELAVAAYRELVARIAAAIRTVTVDAGDFRSVVLAGSGEFLARRAFADARPEFPADRVLSLHERLGPGISSCAAAYAVAVLAAENPA